MRLSRFALCFSLAIALAACSSSAEYPNGIKTNASMGRTPRDSSYPIDKNYSSTPLKGEGLIHTQPAAEGDNAICIGTWCSCATD